MILKIKYWNFHSLDTNPPTLSTYPAIIPRAAFVRAKGRIEKRPESLPYFRPSLNRSWEPSFPGIRAGWWILDRDRSNASHRQRERRGGGVESHRDSVELGRKGWRRGKRGENQVGWLERRNLTWGEGRMFRMVEVAPSGVGWGARRAEETIRQ